MLYMCTFSTFGFLCERECNLTVQFFIVMSRWILPLEIVKKKQGLKQLFIDDRTK